MSFLLCCFEHIFDVCKRRIAVLIGIAIVFIVGILLGAFLQKPVTIFAYFCSFTDVYVVQVFSSTSVFFLFFKRILACLVYVLIAVLVCFSPYLFPLHLFFVLLKGYLFGSICALLICNYAVSGLFLLFLLYLPQNLIFCSVFLVTGLFCFEKDPCPQERLITMCLAAVACALWECLMIFLLFRPLCLFA